MLWVSDIKPKCFNLHNTHQKSNFQNLFHYSEKQNNWKTIPGQKFHLTPGPEWVRQFFKFENPTPVQTPVTINDPTAIYPCFYYRNDHTDSCYCRNLKVTPDLGLIFPKLVTPGHGPNEKRRIFLESTLVIRIRYHLWGLWWSLLLDIRIYAVCDVTIQSLYSVCKPTFWRSFLTQHAYSRTLFFKNISLSWGVLPWLRHQCRPATRGLSRPGSFCLRHSRSYIRGQIRPKCLLPWVPLTQNISRTNYHPSQSLPPIYGS